MGRSPRPLGSRHCGRYRILHTGHVGNKPVTESLYPSTPDDWLIVCGDVAERTDEIRWALDLLRRRFAKVIWVPGNHELWTTNKDPMQIFGRDRYDYLVNMCDELGVVSPEHPFPVWTEAGWSGNDRAVVPALRLLVPAAGRDHQSRGLAIARERNVVCTDEFVLSSEPYPTREAWCHERVAATRKRLDDLDWMNPTVLVNHFPMVRQPCDALVPPGVLAVVRNHRDRGLAHPLTTRSARSTGTCTFRAPPGTTTCASRRCRWATRASGAAASHTAGCARCCPIRSMRPATSTTSAVTS